MSKSNTLTANELAARLSRDLGRTVTAKMVRSAARESLAAYSKAKHPEYQSHAYGPEMARTIRERIAARGTRTTAKVAPKAKAKRSRKATAKAAPVVTNA